MYYPLTERDRAMISKLPPEIAALANKYPSDIFNAAESWNDPSFPDNYIPETIEIFCDNESVVFIQDGELQDYQPTIAERNSTTITVIIDSNFAYIEIEGQEILNKLGGVIFPDIFVSHSELILEIAGELL
ncbi:hypothetical protein LC593_30105 [Nostoc sp. CHAB 5844]|nr:hypothetical protein [Nostoc sp. CHAB 5844]